MKKLFCLFAIIASVFIGFISNLFTVSAYSPTLDLRLDSVVEQGSCKWLNVSITNKTNYTYTFGWTDHAGLDIITENSVIYKELSSSDGSIKPGENKFTYFISSGGEILSMMYENIIPIHTDFGLPVTTNEEFQSYSYSVSISNATTININLILGIAAVLFVFIIVIANVKKRKRKTQPLAVIGGTLLFLGVVSEILSVFFYVILEGNLSFVYLFVLGIGVIIAGVFIINGSRNLIKSKTSTNTADTAKHYEEIRKPINEEKPYISPIDDSNYKPSNDDYDNNYKEDYDNNYKDDSSDSDLDTMFTSFEEESEAFNKRIERENMEFQKRLEEQQKEFEEINKKIKDNTF